MDQLYTLYATEECNYSCSYCEHATKRGKMDKKIFEELFRDSLENAAEDELISFSLFGGEPILNFDLVEHVLKKCYEIKDERNVEVNMTTNLSLLNDRMKTVYKKYGEILTVGVSLDGPKDIYDQNKIGGDFDKVISNYEWLREETNITLGVSMVIDRKYLDRTFDNVKYLFELGFRRFSAFLNLNDWEFLSEDKYRETLNKELDKINKFILEHLNEIKRFKVERYRLDQVGYIEDIVCDLPNVEYVGINGDKFNCTRYKYAVGEKYHEHVDWDKCKNCKFKAYCCSCWGNDSFLYNDIPETVNKKIVQTNYCKLIGMMINKAFKHWEKIKEIKKETKIMKYIRKGETYPLLVNPKKVDIKENAVILVDSIPDFEVETDAKLKMMIEISKINVEDLFDIIIEGLKEDIYHFEFRFKNVADWDDKEIKEYKNQLDEIIKLMKKEGVFHINVIDDILYQNNNYFVEKFIEDGVSYLDPSLEYKYDDIDEDFFNGKMEPICEGCKLGHCKFNPVYNKEITNESIVPSLQRCALGKIEGVAALEFYQMIKK